MASDVGRVSGVQFGVVNAFYISGNCRYRVLTVCTRGIYSFFLADNADAVIDAGTDKVIFFHHATGKDAGFDLFAFSIADSKTYSWMFVLIAHRKAPFIVGVAAGTVKHPQATFDYSFLVVKVDYICHGFRKSNIE